MKLTILSRDVCKRAESVTLKSVILATPAQLERKRETKKARGGERLKRERAVYN